jgi:hypothetical protein
LFADTREQAAELADNRVTPTDLGRFAAAVGRYFNQALICCVRRMHGLTSLRALADECQYPYLWHTKMSTRLTERNAANLGWPGDELGTYFFDPWVDTLHHDRAVLRSLACVDQHRGYVYDATGRPVHQNVANLPLTERKQHGDRVIGCCAAEKACRDLPLIVGLTVKEPAPGSLAERMADAEREQRERDDE